MGGQLLTTSPPPPPPALTRGSSGGGSHGLDRSSEGDETSPAVDSAAVARAAAEEEAAAVAAAVGRAQRHAAKLASEQALLLQLERSVDEAFRAHDHRVWQAAHPATATMLDKAGERIRGLQQQLSVTYEQIRHEQAQQLHLRAQIESRTGNTPAAATARAESLLDAALKSARQSIIATAAANDGISADGADADGSELVGRVGGLSAVELS